MREPEDRLTRGVLDAHEDNSLPVGGRTLYRVPLLGAFVGVLMMAGAAWVSASSVQDLRRWPAAPVSVEGPLTAAHADQWVRWAPGEEGCAGAPVATETKPVVTETKNYQPVPQADAPVVWIASEAPVSCAAPVTGVLRPAVRAVGERLRATAPASEHLVLWTHAGPANAWGLVAGGLVFGMLGLFVMAWFSVIGQRVRDARRRAPSEGGGG
jgi:hypothetical protein